MSKRLMYAVAIRDARDLWLIERISCFGGPDGGVSVLPARDDPRFSIGTPPVAWNPHATCHRNGQLHIRSYSKLPNSKPSHVTNGQKLDASFRGVRPVFALPIQPGEIVQHRIRCVPGQFQGVFEIPIGKLPQEEHHTLSVDIVEPGEFTPSPGPWREVIIQESLRDVEPWISILVTLWRGMVA